MKNSDKIMASLSREFKLDDLRFILRLGDVEVFTNYINLYQLKEQDIVESFKIEFSTLLKDDLRLPIIQYIVSQYNLEELIKDPYSLYIASDASAFGIVKYLIENKCPTSYKDQFQQNVLHIASYGGNKDIVNFLKNCMTETDVYSQNSMGNTFMHILVNTKHSHIYMEIKNTLTGKKLANVKNQQGKKYNDLRKEKDTSIQDITTLKKVTGSNNEDILDKTYDFISSSFELSRLTNKNIESLIIKHVKLFSELYAPKVDYIYKKLYEVAVKYNLGSAAVCIANEVFTKNNSCNEIDLARESISMVYNDYKNNKIKCQYSEEEAVLIYNYALSIKNNDQELAVKLFITANGKLKEDKDIICELFKIYIKKADIKKAFEAASLFSDENVQKIYKFFASVVLSKTPISEILEQYNFEQFNDWAPFDTDGLVCVDISNYLYLKQYQDDLAMENVLQLHNQDKESPQMAAEILYRLLHVLCCKEDWNGALNYIKIYDEEFSSSLEYTNFERANKYKCLVYLMKGDFVSASDIVHNSFYKESYMKFYSTAFVNQITNSEYTLAENTLDELRKLYPADDKALAFIDKNSLLLKNINGLAVDSEEEKVEEDNDVNINVVIDLTPSLDVDDQDDFFSQLTPKQIHTYYKNKKENLKRLEIEEVLNQKQENVWEITGTIYKDSDENIVKISEMLYGVIAQDILNSLEQVTFNKFKAALEKGVCAKSHGCNGIKLINGRLIELKISDQIRLYTDSIYKNSDVSLVVFDTIETNHKKMQNIIQSSEMHYIDLSGDVSGIDTIMS